MSHLRILQLIDSLKVGGAERMAVNIASYLTVNKVDNLLISSRHGGGLEKHLAPEVQFEVLNKKGFYDLAAFLKLVNLVNQFQPDVIHAHSTSIFWAVALKVFSRKKVRVVFHDHYGKAHSLQPSDRKPLRWISSHIDGIIAVNDLLKSWSSANMKVFKNQITQINNFPYLKLSDHQIKPAAKTGILHLANFRPQKDHFTMLEALKILAENSRFDWDISFVGLSESPDYMAAVNMKIDELGIREKIAFIGPSEDVTTFLESASVGVLSSESEGLSVSLLEYGLAGLHVVATNVGQTKTVLQEDNLGRIVPSKDPKALAEALEEAIRDSKHGKNSSLQQHINLHYGPAKFYQSYFQFLDHLV